MRVSNMINLDQLHRIAVTQYMAGSAYRWKSCLAASCIVGRYERGATLALAQDLCISVSQVENLARAGWGWRTFRSYFPIGLASEVRGRLTPTHFSAMFDLWRLYEFDPHDAAGILAECVEHGASVASMRKYVEDTYGSKAADWERRLSRITPQVELLCSDYGVPEGVRLASIEWLTSIRNGALQHETNIGTGGGAAPILE